MSKAAGVIVLSIVLGITVTLPLATHFGWIPSSGIVLLLVCVVLFRLAVAAYSVAGLVYWYVCVIAAEGATLFLYEGANRSTTALMVVIVFRALVVASFVMASLRATQQLAFNHGPREE